MRIRRRRLATVGAVIVLSVLALNVIGILRYPGGPLRDETDTPLWLDIRAAGSGGNEVTIGPGLDRDLIGTAVYDGMPVLANESPWAATIEAITPLDPTPGLVVQGIYVSRPGSGVSGIVGYDAGLPAGQTFDEAYSGLPALVEPTSPGAPATTALLIVHADRPGLTGFSGFVVDYRIGPLTFRTVKRFALTICAPPVPAGVTCPS